MPPGREVPREAAANEPNSTANSPAFRCGSRRARVDPGNNILVTRQRLSHLVSDRLPGAAGRAEGPQPARVATRARAKEASFVAPLSSDTNS